MPSVDGIVLSAPFLTFVVPAVVFLVGLAAKRVSRDEPLELKDIFLGLELALGAFIAACVYLVEKAAAAVARQGHVVDTIVGRCGLFMIISAGVLFAIAVVHRNWAASEKQAISALVDRTEKARSAHTRQVEDTKRLTDSIEAAKSRSASSHEIRPLEEQLARSSNEEVFLQKEMIHLVGLRTKFRYKKYRLAQFLMLGVLCNICGAALTVGFLLMIRGI